MGILVLLHINGCTNYDTARQDYLSLTEEEGKEMNKLMCKCGGKIRFALPWSPEGMPLATCIECKQPIARYDLLTYIIDLTTELTPKPATLTKHVAKQALKIDPLPPNNLLYPCDVDGQPLYDSDEVDKDGRIIPKKKCPVCGADYHWGPNDDHACKR